MDQKVIKLNPEFMKVRSAPSQKAKPKKARPKLQMKSLGEHKLKKKLLSSIHDFQLRAEEGTEQQHTDPKANDLQDEIQVFDTEFDKSIEFLKELAEKKRKQNIINQTIKNKSSSKEHNTNEPIKININTENISNNSTSQVAPANVVPTTPMIMVRDTERASEPTTPSPPLLPQQHHQHQPRAHNQTVKIKPPPPYTCLKNSSSTKPTYRQWMARTNESNIRRQPPLSIPQNSFANAPNTSLRSEKLAELQSKSNAKRKPRKIRRKKMTTLKHKLGKSGRKVSVLIKNHRTRKQIQIECGALKQKKISEVRSYLKKHNLLKGGSVAPNDVLKATYEQAILAGDVVNKSAETLIHNYTRD